MTEALGIARTKEWFEKAVPKPQLKNLHAQTGVHLEEVAEFVDSMACRTSVTQQLVTEASHALKALSQHLKESHDVIDFPDRIETLDGLADQIVTATGIGHMLHMNVVGALDEVNRSNFSKFVDGEPVFNENKKIMKGPNYTVPDLLPFI